MKKLVIFGGEFWKAFSLVDGEFNFTANSWRDMCSVESSKIYRIEVESSTPYDVYNVDGYIVDSNYTMQYQENGYYVFTVRAKNTGKLRMRFGSNVTTDVKIYEYKEYGNVKYETTKTSVNGLVGYNVAGDTKRYLFPVLENGKRFKIKIKALFSGHLGIYYNDSLIYENASAVSGNVYETEFVSIGDGVSPGIRTWEIGSQFLANIEEIN